MIEDPVNDKILEKIQKLLELQKGAEKIGSLEEAANAAGQIQKILMKYNLDISQVNQRENKKKIEVKSYEHNLFKLFDKREGQWLIRLYHHVCNLNSCSLITVGNLGQPEATSVIIGKTHSVQIVVYTCLQLTSKIRIIHRDSWANYKGHEKFGTYRRGFFDGAVTSIIVKMKKAQEELLRVVQEEQTQNYYPQEEQTQNYYPALIRKDKEEVDDFVSEAFKNLKNRTRTKSSSRHGYEEGLEKGKSIHAHQGLEQSKARTPINK